MPRRNADAVYIIAIETVNTHRNEVCEGENLDIRADCVGIMSGREKRCGKFARISKTLSTALFYPFNILIIHTCGQKPAISPAEWSFPHVLRGFYLYCAGGYFVGSAITIWLYFSARHIQSALRIFSCRYIKRRQCLIFAGQSRALNIRLCPRRQSARQAPLFRIC